MSQGSSTARIVPSLEELKTLAARNRAGGFAPIVPRTRGATVPTSFSQERMWFIEQLGTVGSSHTIAKALRLRGHLEIDALKRAFDALICRHEILRTRFESSDGAPVQIIEPATAFYLPVKDLSAFDEAYRRREVSISCEQEACRPFDLTRGPLIRTVLLRLSDSESLLILTLHHIISDGWSISLLARELSQLYVAQVCNQTDALPALPIQYADYAQWQREQTLGHANQIAFWKQHLSGAPALLELPFDRARPAAQSYRGANCPVSWSSELTTRLVELSQRHQLTLSMTLFGAWLIYVSRMSGQPDVVSGMPVANRKRVELESLIGLFVNTLAIRMTFDEDATVHESLSRLRGTILDAYANQDVPFEKVVEALQPARSMSYSPLCQVMFAFQNTPPGIQSLGDLTVAEEELPTDGAQFDVLLSLKLVDGRLCGSLNYATDLLDASTAQRWMKSFEYLLQGLVRQPTMRVSELPLLGDEERTQILEDFNATASPVEDLLIHQFFERRVEIEPDAPAVLARGGRLTYTQLNARANQLARYLRTLGIGPGSTVGIFLERDLDLIVSLLGILKAGGAYVPLDPCYPVQRLQHILEDAAPKVVLTQTELKGRLPVAASPTVIAVDECSEKIATYAPLNMDAREVGIDGTCLAYVIYTSGSTGRPKGVAIEHRCTVNLICWARSAMDRETFDRTAFSTSINFDLSVYECFVPLIVGGAVQIFTDALGLTRETPEATLINSVPSAVKALLDCGGIPLTTRTVNMAGEPLMRNLVERLFEQTRVERVCNLYGPTETTTYSTYITMPRTGGFLSSIGRPIANTRVYILDRHLQPVPIGVRGEIYIGGMGVARGYLNRPDLTAQRFVVDPFCHGAESRMYKTGDLGRWRADGTIDYLGRNDHQVKVRGFRIELGEIEGQLVRHPQVKEAVVVARQADSGSELHAYVVGDGGADRALTPALRVFIKERLPEYMVPSAFVVLDAMPLTPNGKVDRSALPAPDKHSDAEAHVEPKTSLQRSVADIWMQVLGLDRVSLHDNFFELGGHSLLATQVAARVRSTFAVTLPVRTLFDHPSLEQLANEIDALQKAELLRMSADNDQDLNDLIAEVAGMSESDVKAMMKDLEGTET